MGMKHSVMKLKTYSITSKEIVSMLYSTKSFDQRTAINTNVCGLKCTSSAEFFGKVNTKNVPFQSYKRHSGDTIEKNKINKPGAEQDALLEKKLSAYCLLIVTKDAYLA